MRKLLVKTVDVILVVGCLIGFFVGWHFWKVPGLIVALLGGAFLGGTWAALSLICEHLEHIRKNAERQTQMLDALDFNVAAVGEKLLGESQERITAR